MFNMTELDRVDPGLVELDRKVAELAERYRPLAIRILKEAIRNPADEVDRSVEEGGDPRSGLSNHEGSRLQFLRNTIIDIEAVRHADDVWFDEYGNLVWVVRDPFDGVAPEHQKIIYFDGHTDTVQALRGQWHDKLGSAVDPYDGLLEGRFLDPASLRAQLGYVPPEDELGNLVFGRGSADQLAGVVAQIVATKILLELADDGALHGSIVRSYATAAEEDNDGGGPRFVVAHVLPGAGADMIPDVVVLTEGTGDAVKGALGIYRGQRGRMQIEVTVAGRSCHGSMPFEGLNPLEHGGAIIAEAAQRHALGEGFAEHSFLGRGTRTASWSVLDTPSDCAVPDRFTFRFDRRLTVGETPDQALADVEALDAVATARAAGLTVTISAPRYSQPTWRGIPRRQRPDLSGLGDTRGAPVDTGCRRRIPSRRHAARRRACGWSCRRCVAGRTACRQVDLLDGRRRVPDSHRRLDDQRRPREGMGSVRNREASPDVRNRRRHRAEHSPDRRVCRRPRVAACHRHAGPIPSILC